MTAASETTLASLRARHAGADHPSATVEEAARSRRSVRVYLPRPVAREDLERILSVAATAPSGSNTQPWRAYVLTGEPLRALGRDIRRAYMEDEPGHAAEYMHYAAPLPEPYRERRRECGWGLYSTLGITKGDREASKAYRARNYDFFGAPVGIVFSVHRGLEVGSWLDYGMFLQTAMLMARSLGLHTCAEGSIASFPAVVRRHVALTDAELVLCGMAVGYADPDHELNAFQPDRCRISDFATFIDERSPTGSHPPPVDQKKSTDNG